MKELWELQAEQQAELGLDPHDMTDVERRQVTKDLLLLANEELAELARVFSTHKRHLLSTPTFDKIGVAEEVADTFKTLIALAQLWGVSAELVTEAFARKTRVIRSRSTGERAQLRDETKLLCVDMDDVLSDLAAWVSSLSEAGAGLEPGRHLWDLLESKKDGFYREGRFRELPPIIGAAQGLSAAKELGYTVVIVTARPQWQYKRLYADTLEWLDEHGMHHDHVLFNKDKVEAVHMHLSPAWPTFFVDDHERNARALSSAGIPVLLFDRPHNKTLADSQLIRRVDGWQEITRILEEGARRGIKSK